jgi:hypothetical protein
MIGKIKGLLVIGASLLMAGCATRKHAVVPSMELKSSKGPYSKSENFLSNLLHQDPQLDTILKNNNKWHIQVIYTQIDRKKSNRPVFTHYYYNILPDQYFYPASTVKMPVAILALQRLNELRIPNMDKNTTMITEAAYDGQSPVYNDPESEDGRPSIANYIKKIFLVSDNDAFNRLYEFLGQEYINNSLHKMGYDSTQILHRLNISLTEDQNRHTNPVKFYNDKARMIYNKPLANSRLVYQPRKNFLGTGFYQNKTLVHQPFNFSLKNRLRLADLHSILQSIIFPESVAPDQRFNLSQEDYQFLYRYMSMKPNESSFPNYDSLYPEAYSKLLLYGGHGKIDPDIRIFNKEGDAYGFLTDVAYIVDFKNKIEFMLSANILCNQDGIFNDDQYDYETIGYPFLKELGRVIYQYERNRKRKNIPDLSRFKLNYTE